MALCAVALLAACQGGRSPETPRGNDAPAPTAAPSLPGSPGGAAAPTDVYAAANRCLRLEDAQGRSLSLVEGQPQMRERADEATPLRFQATGLGRYLLLAQAERAAAPLLDNASGSGDAGRKALLGVSDPAQAPLDGAGTLVVELGILVAALGDIADVVLDPLAPLGGAVREVGDTVGDAGDRLGDVTLQPRLAVVDAASDLAEWELRQGPDGDFLFTHVLSGLLLSAGEQGNVALAATGSVPRGQGFRLAPAQGCADYPEATLNARLLDPRGPRRQWDDGAVYGWVDDHAHITAYEFIGGRVNYGQTHHRFGVEHALGDCAVHHGPQGATGILEMLTSNDFDGHETQGWPSYNAWPRSDSLQHHQTYYRWIERAWLGGQKVLVNLITHNEVLCQLMPQKKNACDGMENTRLQAQRSYELQDYIDAQHGGPGQGWFRIVTSPAQAREVIAAGKLAVVLGIEMSKPLNCGEFLGVAECSRAQMLRNLDELHALGVRVFFPVHKFDNAFGGHLPHSGFALGPFLTVGNLVETGHPLELETCPLSGDGADDFSADPNSPLNNPAGLVDYLLANIGYLVAQFPDAGQGTDTTHLCNIRGLHAEGYDLLDALMARQMLIDVDHMSRRAASAAIDYLGARGYPMISSHDWTGSESLLNRIAQAGGFIGRFARGGRDQWVERLLGMAARHGDAPYFSGGIASDVNGIANLPRDPREGAALADGQIDYPFRSFDGRVEFDRQQTGDRVFGLYDGRGVAHYGLYPDYLADTQAFGGPQAEQALDIFFRSAEAWLRMWERTGA